MLSDEVIDKVVERLVKRIESGNEYVLKKIGESIKKIGTLSPSSMHDLTQIIDYGGDYDKIVNKLSKITSINTKEIQEIFEGVAKSDYKFAEQFYKYRDLKYVPYNENVALKSQVEALANIASENYMNLSNTRMIGFNVLDNDGNIVFKGLREAYIDTIDTAILNVTEGKETFDEAMRSTLQQLGESGLQVVDYESTYIDKDGNERHYTRRMDSAVRMNLMDAILLLHNEIQEQIGAEFGADGVEITVHNNPAVDHADVQGRQFSFEEFEKLQTEGHAKDYKGEEVDMRRYSKKGHMSFRPISMYNCHHKTFSIVLGVNIPQYSEEQLNEINEENENGFEFEGKHYTNYEGTQLQRRIEAKVRELKNTQILAKASGDNALVASAQEKITQLTRKYKNLSDASGLSTYMERMRVGGYKRIRTDMKNFNEIIYARKNNKIWHSTGNVIEIINDNKIKAPSIAVGKKMNANVRYGNQFIEFKPEILENVNKNSILYKGDGGNKYLQNENKFNSLISLLKNNPENYNEIKFNNDLEPLKYIKRVYIREDEDNKIIEFLREKNIPYRVYKDFRPKMIKK